MNGLVYENQTNLTEEYAIKTNNYTALILFG